jgi:hypothetical protein
MQSSGSHHERKIPVASRHFCILHSHSVHGVEWHYILPNGELHRWDESFEASPLIADLRAEIYDDPTLLTDPQAPSVTASIENGVLIIKAAEGYVGEIQIRVTTSDGYSEVSTTFSVSVVADTEDDDFGSVDNVYSEWDLLEV